MNIGSPAQSNMTDSTLTSVNEHLLDNVMELTASTDITALEDIYDAQGTKLLAKMRSLRLH